MRILSLFDGMSCGYIAMVNAGVRIDRYVAYEIDKYAIQVSSHNFPNIEHCGDVFKADFKQYEGFDFVIGGSPCTYWSIAQTKNRETEAHGIGWELFQQYVRGIKEAKPKYFIYENNKSMADNIKKEISSAFGFEPIMINSSLLSAQNRQRYYWVGVRRENGTYRKANIEQPEDKGILLRDILDRVYASESVEYKIRDGCDIAVTDRNIRNVMNDDKHSSAQESIVYFDDAKTNTLTSSHTPMVINSFNDNGEKSRTLMAGYYKASITNLTDRQGQDETGVAEPTDCNTIKSGIKRLGNIYGRHSQGSIIGGDGKCPTVTAAWGMGGHQAMQVAEPAFGRIVGRRINEDGHRDDGNMDIECVQRFEVNDNPDKTNCLTTVQKDNVVAEPIDAGVVGFKPKENGEVSEKQALMIYGVEGKSRTLSANGGGIAGSGGLVAESFDITESTDRPNVCMTLPNADGVQNKHQSSRVFDVDGKMRTLTAGRNGRGDIIAEPTDIQNPMGFTMAGTFGNRSISLSDKGYCLCANPPSDTTARCIQPADDIGCMRMVRTERGKELRRDYESGKIHHGYNEYRRPDIRDDNKTNTLTTVQKDNMVIEPLNPAKGGKSHTITSSYYKRANTPVCDYGSENRRQVVAETVADSRTKAPMYEVRNGQITIKDKTYPIKLRDGHYIIRKLTVNECKRLQTIPDWYDMTCLSNTQAYKCLGNGWTADVITHLILSVLNDNGQRTLIQTGLETYC